jgi:acyl-CoA thioesterase-1
MKKAILILFLTFLQLVYANSPTQTILFLGDSLTEGLGVSKAQAYPHLVQTMIETKLDKNIKAINAGVSGSTSSDALNRLQWYLKQKPDMVFIALGANDGLRGLNLEQTQKNLEAIITHAKNSGAKVLLSGMLLPPNYGLDYTQAFQKMYENIKEKHNLAYLPFLLQDVAGVKELNQADGIHPNAKGHQQVAQTVFNFLKGQL